MKAPYIILVAFFYAFQGLSQPTTGSISGNITDDKGGPIIGVTIQIKSTNIGAVTNIGGDFKLENIPQGSYQLIISFLGFSKINLKNVNVIVGENTNLGIIQMEESALTLSEIVVTPGQFSIMGNAPLSRQTLKSEDIKNMSFAEDITRAVARLPGVGSNDFSSKFTVRGGEDDEVLITLDGMELYEPFHQRDFAGGLFSIVDIETIQGIDLMTGGFSAEYGNRESGVFNMRTKDVADDEKHTSLGLSIMNARFYTDGKLAKNKGTYLFSSRLGMLARSLKLLGEDENVPSFHDVMGKMEYQLNDRNIISFHGLYSGDKTTIRDIAPEAFDRHDTKYGNSYAWLTWKTSINERVSMRTLFFSGFISHDRNGSTSKDEYSDKLNFELKDKRTYDIFGIKQDWAIDVSDKFILKTGFDVRQLYADYNYNFSLLDFRVDTNDSVRSYSTAVQRKTKPKGQQTSGYVTTKFQVAPKLFLETGIRHDYASYTGDNLVSPRAGFTYSLAKNTFIRGGWGYYYQTQFINNLDVNHNISKFDKAELSKHYILGFEHLFKNDISFRVESYFKDISNISSNYQNLRDPWEVFPETRNDEVRINYNGATSKGLEFFLKYDAGKKVSWWASYALAKAEEDIVSLDYDGLLTKRTGKLPRINNQRHTIYIDVNYRPNIKWALNLSWQYYIGLPQTIYDYEFVEINGENGSVLPLHFYPRHLEFRKNEYPPYHRMDLRINRHFFVSKGKITTFLHIVNLYNRENLRKFDLDVTNDSGDLVPDGNGGYLYPRDDKTWFGFLPVFGAVWEF